MALLFFPFLFSAFFMRIEAGARRTRGARHAQGEQHSPPPPRPSRVYEHKVYVTVYAQILQSEKEETIKKYKNDNNNNKYYILPRFGQMKWEF